MRISYGNLAKLLFIATFGLALHLPARAQESGVVKGSMPHFVTAVRLVPAFGQSSFVTSPNQNYNWGNGFSAGVFADFGKDWWIIESGVLTLNSTAHRSGGRIAADINSWGVPLFAKYNFSGSPQQTVFAKGGVMPITTTTLNNQVDWLGVVGLGATFPLGQNTSLALDGAFNRILNTGSSLGSDYQGISLLAGLSFNL